MSELHDGGNEPGESKVAGQVLNRPKYAFIHISHAATLQWAIYTDQHYYVLITITLCFSNSCFLFY